MPRLPSSADVPTVSPRRATDPGVQAPIGAFESPLGVAAEEFAPALGSLAKAAFAAESRKDAIEFARVVDDVTTRGTATVQEFNTEQDLSDDVVLQELGKSLATITDESVRGFKGSDRARDKLQARLIGIQSKLTGQAAELATNISLARADRVLDDALGPLIEQVGLAASTLGVNDRGVADLMRDFDQISLDWNSKIDDLRGLFDPTQEAGVERAGVSSFSLQIMTTLINRGDVDVAEQLMLTKIGASLTPGQRQLATQKIADVRLSKTSMVRKIQEAETAAEILLGGKLSDTQRAQLFNKLIGLDGATQAKTKVVLNKDTGELEFATEADIVADPNLVPKPEEPAALPTTKQVFNIATNLPQFATEEELAADPNLVPITAGEKITAKQREAAGFALRMEQASKVIDELGPQFTGFVSRIGEVLPQGAKTAARQTLEQAERNFTNAILRGESGAAIAPSEFESAEIQYFPRPGDSEEVLAQKKQNRNTVTQALVLEAGDAFTELKIATIVPAAVLIQGKSVVVGTIVTNSKGQKGRVEQDGSITILEN